MYCYIEKKSGSLVRCAEERLDWADTHTPVDENYYNKFLKDRAERAMHENALSEEAEQIDDIGLYKYEKELVDLGELDKTTITEEKYISLLKQRVQEIKKLDG